MTTRGVSGWMFLLVPAHPGCPGQNPESCITVSLVCVHVCVISLHNKRGICVCICLLSPISNRKCNIWFLASVFRIGIPSHLPGGGEEGGMHAWECHHFKNIFGKFELEYSIIQFLNRVQYLEIDRGSQVVQSKTMTCRNWWVECHFSWTESESYWHFVTLYRRK